MGEQREIASDNPMDGDQLEQFIKTNFPGGDPEFAAITASEMALYSRKNQDYAAGGGDPNGNFNRVGSILKLYPQLPAHDPRAIALIYMLKQLDQVLWSLHRGYQGSVEGLDERLADIHVYTKIARVINRRMVEPEETRKEAIRQLQQQIDEARTQTISDPQDSQ